MKDRPVITGDFETRSAQDIQLGPWTYSKHKSTDALCFAYQFGDDPNVRLWHRGTKGIAEAPPPQDLFDAIRDGWAIEAHNSLFERAIWTNVMQFLYDWPEVPDDQWLCSAARCAYFGLPRGLGDAALVLRVKNQKDLEGAKVMRQLAVPMSFTARERKKWEEEFGPMPEYVWNEDETLIRRNWEYCKQDVRTEHSISHALPPMPEFERRIWAMDQRMNLRGITCDKKMAEAAIKIATEESQMLNFKFELTTGVERATKRKALLSWIQSQGVDVMDTQASTLEKVLVKHDRKMECECDVCNVIRITRKVNRSSTAKYQAMIDRIDTDGRLRDNVMYHGAHTGRWSGKGVQPQNFPRGTLGKGTIQACEDIRTCDRELLHMLYGDVMQLLSHALRGALMASPGKILWVADYASIEARVLFWLARAHRCLEIFTSGQDIYCDMASKIYGRTITKKDKDERQFGKQAILGLGYGCGFCKFLLILRSYKIVFTEEQCRALVGKDYETIKKWVLGQGKAQVAAADLDIVRDLPELVLTKYVVDLYRGSYPEVPGLWKEQENAAITAVRNPKLEVEAGKVVWKMNGRRLECHLPAGRFLSYWDPRISTRPTPWGEPKLSLNYWGIDSKTKQWAEGHTYGGSLVENIDQAISRDLLAEAMLRVDDHPIYDLLLSVHDEVVAESDPDAGSQDEFDHLVKEVPTWADGCPVEVEGFKTVRYRK